MNREFIRRPLCAIALYQVTVFYAAASPPDGGNLLWEFSYFLRSSGFLDRPLYLIKIPGIIDKFDDVHSHEAGPSADQIGSGIGLMSVLR